MNTSFLKRSRRFPIRLAAAFGLSMLAPLSAPVSRPALAQNAPVIGVVDAGKINQSFTKLKTALEAIDKRKETLRTQIDGRVFLAEADAKRFDELILKASRTPDEESALNALAKKGNDRRGGFNALIAKEKKSDDDNKKIKEFEDESAKSAEALQRVVAQIDKVVSNQEIETEDQFRAQIVKAVEEVATGKKLLVVVGKQAVAWSSATVEITDDVIARLNQA
jgi:Skp family chaperone for outer membrane proteins